MSGIVGIYNLDGRPVEQLEVQRMLDSIAHRGPDGSGIWTDGPVGLGHRMLWTTPESLHEKLPLTNKTGDLTITADARIDNRDELIPALNLNDRPRETITDSEIILAAYEKWGEKCPEKLLGDFSFAIWDKRRQQIYCARDPIGIKPFYYYFKGGVFRWSSEPKAIFEDKAISKEPNLPLICLYLLNRFDEREETLYRDVYRLPSSHFMVLENGRIRKDQYWDVDPNCWVRYKTDQEYAEHFLELFKEAVRVRLRSHGPVGAMLSGGLDSSSIVCTAQLLYQKNPISNNGFETFSLIFDQFPCDERNYIDEVVHMWNLKASYFVYETNLESVDFEKVEDYPDVSYFPTLLSWGPILKNAQQNRIRTMINGIGGDDLFTVSFDHLTDLLARGNIFKLLKQFRSDTISSSQSSFSIFLNYCVKPLIPQPVKTPLKTLLKPFRGNGIPHWMNIEYLKKTQLDNRLHEGPPLKLFPTRSQQRIYESIRYGWNVNIALDMVERFTAYFGMDCRLPFFDQRLIEFLFALPEEQRWKDEWTKTVLRRAMDGMLPDIVKKRKDKAEFSPTIDLEFRNRQLHKMEKILQSSVLVSLEIIHSDHLQQLFNDYQKGIAEDKARNCLERILWLEIWYRTVMK